jgi:hypothetical protein
MRTDDPNLPYLRLIAEALGDLREQVVFVGGAVAGLLVSATGINRPLQSRRNPAS